jgi:alkyl hydroperoxide reductase subunit F
MDFLVLTGDIGGQTIWSSGVENYTGYQLISGVELAQKFEDHMRQYGSKVRENESVISLEKNDGFFTVATAKVAYQSRTVIIASGKRSRELNVAGEKEFWKRGVTSCATCDGPLFSGKDVAVVGNGNSALDAALQMVRLSPRVYIINNALFLAGDAIMREKVLSAKNATVINDAEVVAVLGDKLVTAIRIRRENRLEEIPVQGIFVEIGLIPNSDFASLVKKNDLGEIEVDCRNATNVEGIFAAGDVTSVPEKQIIIAAGEGAKACLSAFRYLSQHKF